MMMMMMMEHRRSSGKEKVSQAQETRRLTANRRRCPSWGSGKLWEKLCGAIPDQEWRWRSLTLSLCVCESVSLSSFSPQHRSHGSKGLLAPPYLTNNESPYREIRSQPAALRSAGAADCHTTYYANGVSPRGRSVGGLFLSSSSEEDELLLTSWVFPCFHHPLHQSHRPPFQYNSRWCIHPSTSTHPSSKLRKMMPLHTREREYPNSSLSLSFAWERGGRTEA